MTNWQTTVAGIAAFVSALALAVKDQFDGDPSTAANWNVVVLAFITMVGFLRTRDSSVSDEQAGAGRSEPE